MSLGHHDEANDEKRSPLADGDDAHIPVPSSLDEGFCLRFHDHSRFWSAELIRLFTSARAASHGPESHAAGPPPAPLDLELELSNTGIVRGID